VPQTACSFVGYSENDWSGAATDFRYLFHVNHTGSDARGDCKVILWDSVPHPAKGESPLNPYKSFCPLFEKSGGFGQRPTTIIGTLQKPCSDNIQKKEPKKTLQNSFEPL
jgi:hypothetical protein